MHVHIDLYQRVLETNSEMNPEVFCHWRIRVLGRGTANLSETALWILQTATIT